MLQAGNVANDAGGERVPPAPLGWYLLIDDTLRHNLTISDTILILIILYIALRRLEYNTKLHYLRLS